jgi:hypothetical protein
MALVFQWLAMLIVFVSAIYFCLGMAFGWPIAPFFLGFGAAAIFAFMGYVFRSRRS